ASIAKVVMNAAPAISNDESKLYVAVSQGDSEGGYLVVLDSSTLNRIGQVRLKDANGNDALLNDNGSASPMIGPHGDVFFGVLGTPIQSNNYRGWLLHFSENLSQTYIPAAFGWDITPSVVPRAMVPSYAGGSSYLLMTKYNNYSAGQFDLAILDPQDTM